MLSVKLHAHQSNKISAKKNNRKTNKRDNLKTRISKGSNSAHTLQGDYLKILLNNFIYPYGNSIRTIAFMIMMVSSL